MGIHAAASWAQGREIVNDAAFQAVGSSDLAAVRSAIRWTMARPSPMPPGLVV
jgi:hypothetical protein